MGYRHRIQVWLQKTGSVSFALYCMFFSFSTYFCMYAFRKPFSVATFEGSTALLFFPPLQNKILYLISQIAGYTLSKFIGIKFVSESTKHKRLSLMISLILVSHIGLLSFALLPQHYKCLGLFINGLPLGMIWGLVFAYLEGRNLSILLGVGLSVSFIVSSGVMKSIGKYLLTTGIPEIWMPFCVGLFFLPIFCVSAYGLNLLPPPTAEEEKKRTKRIPMTKRERQHFFSLYAPALLSLTFVYMFLTSYRDFRDNFAREIWDSLGFGQHPSIFSITEIPIAIGVLILLGLLVFIRDKRKSFIVMNIFLILGSFSIGLGTWLFQHKIIGAIPWMMLSGTGLFLAYVPLNCIFYDDLIAITGFAGTAGFMIYVSDAFGYLGSVLLMILKNFGFPISNWIDFFIRFSYFTAFIGCGGFLFSMLYLLKKSASLQEVKILSTAPEPHFSSLSSDNLQDSSY